MSLPQSTKKHDAGHVPGTWNCPNTVEIRMQLQLPNNKLIFHTIHGAYSTTPASIQSLATALFGSLSSAWSTNLATYMNTGTIFQAVICRDMANTTFPTFIGTGTAVPGTGVGAALPESNAIVMTENLNARGRGAKGRIYLGGWIQTADVTIGGINTAVQTAINAMGTAWISALSAQSLTACVAKAPRYAYMGFTGTSHAQRGTPGSGGTPGTGSNITVSSYTCRDLVWDTQRRRVQP
jgi:hypothetical protein